MTNIKIEAPFKRDEFLKENMLRVKLVYKPYKRNMIGLSITSTLFLLATTLLYLDDAQFNPFLLVTSIFGTITLFYVYSINSSRNQYKEKILEIANEFEAKKLHGAFEITEEGIDYSDQERTFNLKWPSFKYFAEYDNYIIVSMADALENAYFFDRHDMSKEDLEAFLSVLKNKLPQRAIK